MDELATGSGDELMENSQHCVLLAPGSSDFFTVLSNEFCEKNNISAWRIWKRFGSKQEAIDALNQRVKLQHIDPQYIRPTHPDFFRSPA